MIEIKIPRECYKYGGGVEQVRNEGGEAYDIVGYSTNETIQLMIKDAMATWAVYVYGDILPKTNAIKSLFIENIKLLTRKQFILGTLYTFWNIKELSRFLQSFNRQAFRIASVSKDPYFLKEKHLTRVSRELQFCIFIFLVELGIEESIADKFSEIFSHILEYDNAYRFRFLDIMGSTSKEELKSNHKAIRSLIERIKERDLEGIADKYIKIIKILKYALWIPRVKRAFNKVIEEMDIENLQPQEADRYWFCTKNTYKFMGMTDEERKSYAQAKGWKYPEGLI